VVADADLAGAGLADIDFGPGENFGTAGGGDAARAGDGACTDCPAGSYCPFTTAAVILRSRGASGANIDYFRSLLACMRARGVRDAHLEAIDERIRAAGKEEEEGAGAEKCEARSS
jgi:hypothetical protein